MEAANTKHLKFAPDVGQLQKGGADAAQVVKDFLPITVHMHLKDFSGGEHFAGYCPLGQGKVDLKAILDSVEGANPNANVMVELDGSAEHALHAARDGADQQGLSGEARIQVQDVDIIPRQSPPL